MVRRHPILLTLIAVVALTVTTVQAATTVQNVRIWAENGKTRVVLDLSKAGKHTIFTLRGPDRLVVDLKDGRLSSALKNLPKGVGSVRAIRSSVQPNGQLRVVLDLNQSVRSRSFTTGPNSQYADRLVIDLQPSGNLQTVKRASEGYDPGRDIVIAVDAGHGGHDPGSIGKSKTREKDVALAVSKKLAARINAEPGMRAILIRKGDYYVDHRKRMDIARQAKADLFVSIHTDAVKDRRAKGASVYALSTKGASDEAAKQLAARENASVYLGDVQLNDKDPVLASVLLDLSQSAALSASLDVGSQVMGELARIGSVHRRQVQQAGLLVLKSADMPSILVETAYISNPSEEKKLRSSAYQDKLAGSIHNGVRAYFYANPPPDTQIAMNVRKKPVSQVRHVIARGDTISEIAERYNVSEASIRSANKLRNDKIRVGQALSIPVYAGT
jgi:N-acetylmuramoyl-L-alanine amidase